MDLLASLIMTIWIVSALLSLILFVSVLGEVTLSLIAVAIVTGPIGLMAALMVFGERVVLWK